MYGKFLHVDLGSGSFRDHVVPEEIARKYIGGKGLGVYLLDSLTPPGTGALDPGNVLIFLTGPFTGTPFPTSGRFVVVTRSPLTGMYVDSHAGGHFAKELRMAGYDGIIVTGKADRPVYLWLEDGKAELRDASDLWGKTVDDTVFAVREKTDGSARVAVIGPAGENLVPIATITMDSDSDKSRAGVAGRGGSGAVMGSKNLKAIAVRGTGTIPVAEEGPFREQVAEIVKAINANDQIHTRRIVGTSSLVESMSRTGILPSYNFQQGYFVPIYGLVSTNLRHYTKRDVACSNCPIICGKVLEDDGHPVKVEYESIALLGSNNGVGKMPLLTKAVRICNQLGLDTISAGGIVGFAMECRQKGILSEAPEFGDAEGQAKLLEDIAYRRGLGAVLAEGVRAAAGEIGKGTDHFAIHVKGMELPGYEPRATWGMALAYATSDRGGCHQRAWTVLGELDGHLPRFSTEGMAKTVKTVQDERAAAYSLVVCDFAPYSQERALACLRHVTGWDISEEEYLTAGERIWNHIRMFNIREAGISRKDDTLPPRMFEDPLPMPPRGEEKVSLKREDFDRMLDEYYELRGWDSDGRPKAETVERLGIQVRI
ncbi:MAG TPA: aldehyde ferredoxin oxidoreductase [Synergistaceae bacterium]|jgi:aldehyde:ferredoxin oxidoreductase|nr:aldehyde ferredoxin oxidoreductase [Synergistaceae bacterium]